jgi:dihydroorotase-like cyclic amidohydrolase
MGHARRGDRRDHHRHRLRPAVHGQADDRSLQIWRAKSEGKACIDYGLHMAVTDLGPNDAWLDDVDAMVAEGISSFKIFMAYPNVLMVERRAPSSS